MDGDAPGMEPEPVAGAALGGERRREIGVTSSESTPRPVSMLTSPADA